MRFDVSMSTKISTHLLAILNKVSLLRGEPRSNLVRRAILKEVANYLSPSEREALNLSAK